ncbi:MFS transporter [Verrucomicrobium sp. BvORR034]|uniref:MFS transporter n=1 Tax=Verrucomicrobium sp. BvORR034 TaxID=1396418 RepID=UPI000678C9FA|nr:MFS transporter [Verrucomicrobium sp. BvORR034]
MSSSPVSAIDAAATPELDGVAKLPAANSRSFSAMIAVQALNAFNDNFVKILLIAFALSVAEKTFLGENMQLLLGACFCLPYIFFAPVAGWLSDRYSKQQVIFWMQVAQVGVFGCFLGSLALHQAQTSLILSLVCFFLLATQAAFFSPAKLGIAKELVGSKRLGSASGILQLSNFAGILSGMALAGWWFGQRLDAGLNPWQAVWFPMVCVTILAVAQVFGSLLIMRTPVHAEIVFHRKIWLEHFSHLKLLFSQRPLMLAAIGVTYFWFITYTISAILVVWCHETFPDKADASRALSTLSLMLGAGVIPGSFLASIICRRRLELGLVPIAGFAMAIALFWGGIMPVSPWLHLAMVGVGMAGGAFMSPLYAFVQDRSRPEERARILSAMNLMDSIGGVIANLVVVSTLVSLGFKAGVQILILVPIALAAAVFITKLLPRSLLMIIGRAIVVAMYRLRSHHEERTPDKGSLLLLPNHTSYTDALMIGATCERKFRFVILESLYEIKAIQWALKVFGTVPISPVKAKDAIRTVAEALKAEQAVVLFPEGQLTRNGYLNQINKGYELMARMGGDVKVQPVWIDGLWGSVFSFDQGRFFTKRPRTFRYAVSTWYGHPLPAREATVERMRQELLALAAEAFAARAMVQKRPGYTTAEGRTLTEAEARITQLNTLRVLHTALIWKDDSLLCLLPASHPLHASFTIGLPDHQDVTVFTRAQDVKVQEGKKLVVIGDTSSLTGYTAPAGAFVVHVLETADFPGGVDTLPEVPKALYDAATGALLTLSVPHPDMPVGEEGLQVGYKTGSAGHFLPSLAMRTEGGDLVFGAILPGSPTEARVVLPGAKLDDMGFVFPGA